MRTIETNSTITPDGQLLAQVPSDIPPGQHRIVLVIEEHVLPAASRRSVNLPVLDLGPWPENLSLRREDMYGDEGR